MVSLLQREWRTAVTYSSDDQLWLQSKSLDTLQLDDAPADHQVWVLLWHIKLPYYLGGATSVVLLPINENIMFENYGKEEIWNIIPLALCKEMITQEI